MPCQYCCAVVAADSCGVDDGGIELPESCVSWDAVDGFAIRVHLLVVQGWWDDRVLHGEDGDNHFGQAGGAEKVPKLGFMSGNRHCAQAFSKEVS